MKNNKKTKKQSNIIEKQIKTAKKTPDFFAKYFLQIITGLLFFFLLIISFSTIYNSVFHKIQYQILSSLKIPFSNLYFFNYKLTFPNFFIYNFCLIILILTIFFILYAKKLNAIKDLNNLIEKLIFFFIITILYFSLIAVTIADSFFSIQVILFIVLILYFLIYSLYQDLKNKIIHYKFNFFTKKETILLVLFSFFVLFLNIFDYKSWKYSFIGDEWFFYNFAKDIINGKVNLNLFSEQGVYGYHPVLSSIWQAIIMFFTDKGLFGWKLSSALIIPLCVIPFYLWNKMVFNSTVAVIATVAFALSGAMLAFSHIGYNNIQTIFFYVTVLCFFEIALSKKSNFYLSLTSLMLGLGFYTFYSSRLMIFIIIFYIILHPQRKNFKISNYLFSLLFYLILVSPIILNGDFLNHILRQTAFGGSEIKNPSERPAYFFMNFIYSFFAFLTKYKNSHYMIDGLMDIFSAIGILSGLIWSAVSFKNDWRARFLLITYFFLILTIGALHQYHYPVNTRLMFLVPLLATIAGVGFSRMIYLITYFKKSKQLYLITLIIFCLIIFLINHYTFYIKMPKRLQFSMQAYIMKILQTYEKFDKILVTPSNLTNFIDVMQIYGHTKKTVICPLPQFDQMLKNNLIKNKLVIFHFNYANEENKIMRLVKPGFTLVDNETRNIIFYIYNFINDNEYYNAFYELWTTGTTNYVIKINEQSTNKEADNIYLEKDTIKKKIKYKLNNKIKKYNLFIYKNFQFEETYRPMRNSEIINYKVNKLILNTNLSAPSDISYDKNSNILFVADSKEYKIYRFIKKQEDNFELNAKIDIPVSNKTKNEEYQDILFITSDYENKLLYVLDSIAGKIFEFDYDGNFKKQFIESDYLKGATDIKISRYKNDFIISNPEENLILIFDKNGNLIDTYSTTRGIGEGQLNRPTSAEVVANTYFLIADSLNGRIQLFDNNKKYVKNFRIGICSRVQWPDIIFYGEAIKPYFVVTQPANKKIFIFLFNEDAFRYINLFNNKSIKFLNPSKIEKYEKESFYLLDTEGKFIVRLQISPDFINEKIDFPQRR